MQHVPIIYPARHRFEEINMRNRSEVIRQIRLYDPRMPAIDQAINGSNCRMGAEVRSVAMQLRGHVDLEDGV